ncbi:MAG: hypothetical protein NWE89_05475 [Candidatus Bathyarchaeota archaeon]|nr:hypothetical protein [Candidatus Bathyarchaeota archaeon]
MKEINNVPVSLYKTLSEKLVSLILDSENNNAVSTETTKKIIYLWRQDQLASTTGIETLIHAAIAINVEDTVEIMNELGLQELSIAVKNR